MWGVPHSNTALHKYTKVFAEVGAIHAWSLPIPQAILLDEKKKSLPLLTLLLGLTLFSNVTERSTCKAGRQ